MKPMMRRSAAGNPEVLPTLVARAPREAASILDHYPDGFVAQMLASLNPALAQSVLERFKVSAGKKIIAAAFPAIRQQWIRNEAYPENTIGHCWSRPWLFPARLRRLPSDWRASAFRGARPSLPMFSSSTTRTPARRGGDAGDVAGTSGATARRDHDS